MNRGLWGVILALGLVMPAWGADGGPVKIAVMTDLGGVYSDLAGEGAVIAAEMAVQDFGGSVLGRSVEVIAEDHRDDPHYAVKAAARLAGEGVDAYAELMGSEVAVAVQRFARSKGLVTLVSGATTPRLTNQDCSPTGVHWAYDAYSLAVGTGFALTRAGVHRWYFVTVDYPQGISLERAVTSAVVHAGGQVLGSSRHPFQTRNMAPYLLDAQASGADAIALLNAGGDTFRSIRQAYELGISAAGQRIVPGLLSIADIRRLGLYVTAGLTMSTAFYWNSDARTREWAHRFQKRYGAMPTQVHASVYSSVSHYLKAMAAAGTDDGRAAVAAMRRLPVHDFFAPSGRVRADGRMVHDMKLVRVNKPSESKTAWDYFTVVGRIPGDQAFLPLKASRCPLLGAGAGH